MYLNNSSSINNKNQNSVPSQQRHEPNETCSLNPGDLNFQQPKAIIGKNKGHCEEANENLKHKYTSTSGMAEKRKKLPPGYVNVSTTNLSDINCDEETKNGTGHVSYVNTGCIQNESILSRIQSESQSSPDLVGLGTNTFKFGFDPIKPEIPFNDSHPPISSIAPPPLMKKLSPQKTSASTQRNSLEFRTNNQCINNEISSTSAIINNNEIKQDDEMLKNRPWYSRSKSRSFSSSIGSDALNELVEETKDNMSCSYPNSETRLPTLYPEAKCEDNRCISSSSSGTFDELLSPSKLIKSTANKENIIFDETDSCQKDLHLRPNSFNNCYLESAYQNTGESAILKESHSHGNKKMSHLKNSTSSSSFSPLAILPSNLSNTDCENFSHPKQYIHSAGGGCVSPIGDSSPHVLITSQNYFPYDQEEKYGATNHKFSVTNPFLPLIQKEKELNIHQNEPKNPFLWISPDEKSNKHQIEIFTCPRVTPENQFTSESRQFQAGVSNNSSFNVNSTNATGNPVHVHHHHFYHPYNQSSVPSNIFRNQEVVNNNSMRNFHPEPHSISFTPPPFADFPINNQANERNTISQNNIVPNGNANENVRLVLKPKKELLSYKDLENILLRNKALLSKCGWYYGKMKADESTALLNNTPPGTFLVRDSSDPKYWFSLSMQRGNNDGQTGNKDNSGPTSIRIHFVNGKFQLDAEDRIRNIMPEFDTIIDLVQYYVATSLYELKKVQEANSSNPKHNKDKSFQNAKSQTLWVDSSGKLYQTIFLAYPLYRKDETKSLSHMCRLSINTSIISKITKESAENIYNNNEYLDAVRKLNLPVRVQDFLREYPNII